MHQLLILLLLATAISKSYQLLYPFNVTRIGLSNLSLIYKKVFLFYDAWYTAPLVKFSDSSISLLCVCAGQSKATQIILPSRFGNRLIATNVYYQIGEKPDPVTGDQVLWHAGVAAGGVQLSGSSDSGDTKETCPSECIAWWSSGELLTSYDNDLQVIIPPPGDLYHKVSGPNGGVRSGGYQVTCIGKQVSDASCTSGGSQCVFSGGPCIILASTGVGTPDYAFTAACADSAYVDEGDADPSIELCVGGSLTIADIVQTVEFDQTYT
ncbi:hypothetical protein BC940DRAFT_336309 [Gongronella butleri]|nr:hypothetical protein BC940DRAFT_336309 [Gongronella butleri]